MKENELRSMLWDKVNEEFKNFKEEMLESDKESIFTSAYKIVVLTDLRELCNPDINLLSSNEVKALLKEEYPIDLLYRYYMKNDTGNLYDIYESIWDRLSNLISKNLEIKNKNDNER